MFVSINDHILIAIFYPIATFENMKLRIGNVDSGRRRHKRQTADINLVSIFETYFKYIVVLLSDSVLSNIVTIDYVSYTACYAGRNSTGSRGLWTSHQLSQGAVIRGIQPG